MGDVFTEKVDANSGLNKWEGYIVFLLEFIINESFDDGGLTSTGVTQENDLEGSFANGWTGDGHGLGFSF